MIQQVVTDIENVLSEVVELQKDHVANLCARCNNPCCGRVSYLFCEKDILFLRLSGRKTRWKREAFKKKGCWFLGPSGCILDPYSRPLICHRYLCSDLEKEIGKHDPGLLLSLDEKFKLVDELRSQMWSEYLESRMDGTGRIRSS